MISNDHNFCIHHKAREEFVCVNSKCIKKETKLSCYKCLDAEHIDEHNPKEDFKSIYTLIEKINQERKTRLSIVENAKQWSLILKKENIQALEKLQIISQQNLQEISSKIEEQYAQCYHKLNYIQCCLEETNPISRNCIKQLIFFYKQNIEQFSEEIETIKFQFQKNTIISSKQSNVAQIENQKKMQDQIQVLENKFIQLSSQRSYFYSAIIILISIIIFQTFFFPRNNFENQVGQKSPKPYLDNQNIQKETDNVSMQEIIKQLNQQIIKLSQEIIVLNDTLKNQQKNYNSLEQQFKNFQLQYNEQLKNIIQEIDQQTKLYNQHKQKQEKSTKIQEEHSQDLEQIIVKLNEQTENIEKMNEKREKSKQLFLLEMRGHEEKFQKSIKIQEEHSEKLDILFKFMNTFINNIE